MNESLPPRLSSTPPGKDTDPWAVLNGEEPIEAIADPALRAKAGKALDILRDSFQPPSLDQIRARLETAPLPDLSPRSSRSFLGLEPSFLRAAAAGLLLALGLAALAVWFFYPDGREDPVVEGPLVFPVAQGAWGLRTGGSVIPDRKVPTLLRPVADGTIELREGRAMIRSEGRFAAPTPLLTAAEDGFRLAMAFPGRLAIRVLDEGLTVGLSVFEGDPGAVHCSMTGTQSWRGGAGADLLIQFQRRPGQVPRQGSLIATASSWPTVHAPAPPSQPGEVLVWLKEGRLLRGTVCATSPLGLMLRERSDPGLPENKETQNSGIPESILFREVAEWTPAHTPRGRDVYAGWLQKILPRQLQEVREKRSFPEIPPEQERILPLLDPSQRMPEVAYGLGARKTGERYLFARPLAPDLGAAVTLSLAPDRAPGSATGPASEF